MANILVKDSPFVFCGLGTLTNTIKTATPHFVRVQLSENPPSGLNVVVNSNGSPIYTAPVITPSQIAQQFKFEFLPAISDVITVVLASSSQIDNNLNTIKSTVYIGGGL